MGKYENGKNRGVSRRTFVLLLALVLVLGVAAGGTVAWLTSKTSDVVNTFTTSNIDINLTEETTDYKMVPGYTIAKDPKVTVLAGSEKCYLFVKLEKSTNFDDFLTYEVDNTAWTQGDGTNIPANVYYRVVETSNNDQVFEVIKDNQVKVLDTVTKDMMSGLTTAATYPTLTVTAYASQFSKDGATDFTAAEAWTNVNSTSVAP